MEWQRIWGMHPSAQVWKQIEEKPHPEYPTHPLGFPLLIGGCLYALGLPGNLIEPAALACVALLSWLTAMAFYSLAVRFSPNRRAALTGTILLIMATPMWHYSRALYPEMALSLVVMGSMLNFFDEKYFRSGLFIGAGFLVKPVVLFAAAPLIILLITRRRFKAAIRMAAPIGLAGALFAAINTLFWGSPLRMPQLFVSGPVLTGLAGLLGSPEKGLFGTSPILLLGLILWPQFARRHGLTALSMGFAALFYVLVISAWGDWRGGACYGPRLIVPIMPILFLPLLTWVSDLSAPGKSLRKCSFIALIALSVLINWLSVTPYWRATRATSRQGSIHFVPDLFLVGR
jgi:hypothetical protein